ncbi:MAG: ABC transporter ATP-binding protein [Xanthobacteraceae bacterium]|jgi:NitT/TauT family transport system ATP-binding protein
MVRAEQVKDSSRTVVTAAATPAQQCHISLNDVTLQYGKADKAVVALRSANLEVGCGEFVALIGPSGCGKSTLLRLVCGLLQPTVGTVRVGSTAGAPRIGMAFQNATLLPWLTILQNVMLPLKIVEPMRREFRAKRKTEFRDRAVDLLRQVRLAEFVDKHPWQLSGGMLQRASLCRALIHNPSLVLLDEPFAALDQFTREELWGILQQLWMTHRPTILMVTHDFREAVYLATRLCVMQARPGRIVQQMKVPFARPRTLEMTYEPGFTELVRRARMQIDETRAKDRAS